MSASNDVVGKIMPKSSTVYFEWEIAVLSISSKNPGEFIWSPMFTTLFSEFVEWRLKLFPKGDSKEDKDWLTLYLYYYGSKKITTNVALSILDDRNRKLYVGELGETVFDIDDDGWGWQKLAKTKDIEDENSKVLIDGKLKILCEITFKPDFIAPQPIDKMDSSRAKLNVSSYKLKAFHDFEKLFENGSHSDVTINIGENKILAHKAIITSRSPVFDAMFKHDMKEKEKNTIHITDISYEVMKEVLRFMYASTVNNIEQIAKDLLIAAEKYSVEGLKTFCEETLRDKLNTENAIEFLRLADMCDTMYLKGEVITFIVDNQQAVTGKPEFELFGDLDSKLQCELVRALVDKNSN